MLLPWLILIPFISGLLCLIAEKASNTNTLPRVVAMLSMMLLFLLLLAEIYGSGSAWIETFRIGWIERFGISIHLALDGLSGSLLMLTSFLGLLAVICSWREIETKVGFFHLNLMWIISAVAGVFLSIDLFLFFIFWEVMLIPMYFLIALWGHSDKNSGRIGAARKFLISTQASGLLMLLSIIAFVLVHYVHTNEWTFDYSSLLHTHTHTPVIMLGFLIAFAVKLPVVPLHGWLPDAHAQAPTAGSVDLAGILLKTAAYGMLRFAIPLFPYQSSQFAPVAMLLGLIGIYYGAMLAFSQIDLKRIVACSSISHMGFVLIAIYSGNLLALQGAIMLMIAHALSASGLFLISGQLYERIKTRDMRRMGGLFGLLGAMPGFTLAFLVATLGMPGTGNFIGEFLVLFGCFSTFPWVVLIASGSLVFAAIYSLVLMHRVYYGVQHSQFLVQEDGLSMREVALLSILVLLILILGFFPQLVLNSVFVLGRY